VQMLFQSDMGKQDAEQTRKIFWSDRQEMDEGVRDFANDIFRVAMDRGSEIDQVIEAHAPNWKMDRMAAVDRNVIRAAVAEMIGMSTPPPVVINEAIEIARKFSSPEALNFINGVLDSVAKDVKKTKDDVRRTK
jgi:transcription antitermination protein NusB